MAIKQTRRSISISLPLFEHVKNEASKRKTSLSQMTELCLARETGFDLAALEEWRHRRRGPEPIPVDKMKRYVASYKSGMSILQVMKRHGIGYSTTMRSLAHFKMTLRHSNPHRDKPIDRRKVLALLNTEQFTQREIANMLECSYQYINAIFKGR